MVYKGFRVLLHILEKENEKSKKKNDIFSHISGVEKIIFIKKIPLITNLTVLAVS